MTNRFCQTVAWAVGLGICSMSLPALAVPASCVGLPSFAALKSALTTVVAAHNDGGLGFNMWATVVANDGTVCAVAFSGGDYTDQWLGSRLISAQKAETGNGFSLSKTAPPKTSLFPAGLALSTANLYSAVQPGGSLYGLQHSNPVDATIAYQGSSTAFGTASDPLVGNRIGGVNVFGGGLALYTSGGTKIGGVGVSGDTSCTDHFIAWRVRHALNLDHLGNLTKGGVTGDPKHPDNIIFDISVNKVGVGEIGVSASGFGHPTCINYISNPKILPPVSK
jgi:Haem-degrading